VAHQAVKEVIKKEGGLRKCSNYWGKKVTPQGTFTLRKIKHEYEYAFKKFLNIKLGRKNNQNKKATYYPPYHADNIPFESVSLKDRYGGMYLINHPKYVALTLDEITEPKITNSSDDTIEFNSYLSEKIREGDSCIRVRNNTSKHDNTLT
jgi:hypothetical protein